MTRCCFPLSMDMMLNYTPTCNLTVVGADVQDMSRVSTAMVADITNMDMIPPLEDALNSRISLPWADVSAISSASDIPMPRVSLPAIDMSSLVEPPPLSDMVPLSVMEPMSISVLSLNNEAGLSVFDRTLRSDSADLTLQGVC